MYVSVSLKVLGYCLIREILKGESSKAGGIELEFLEVSGEIENAGIREIGQGQSD